MLNNLIVEANSIYLLFTTLLNLHYPLLLNLYFLFLTFFQDYTLLLALLFSLTLLLNHFHLCFSNTNHIYPFSNNLLLTMGYILSFPQNYIHCTTLLPLHSLGYFYYYIFNFFFYKTKSTPKFSISYSAYHYVIQS